MPRLTSDQRRGIAREMSALESAKVVEQFEPNAGGQERAVRSTAHELLILGGNSAGKTFLGMNLVGYHILPERDKYGNPTGKTMHPYLDLPIPEGGVEGWISSYNSDVQRDNLQRVFNRVLKPYTTNIHAESGVYHYAEFDYGWINFKWQTQGVEAYAGPKKHFIYMDEPHKRAIYNEAKMRLLRSEGYMWLCATPIASSDTPLHAQDVMWMKDDLVDPWLRNRERYPMREVVYINVAENYQYVKEEFVDNMLAGMSISEQHVRRTGMFVVLLGTNCFNPELLNILKGYLLDHEDESQPDYGYLSYDETEAGDWRVTFRRRHDIEDFPAKPEGAFIYKIWEHPVPDAGPQFRPEYLISADVAEGVPGGDYTNAYVFRLDTRRVVASLHGHLDELTLAKELWLLGNYYCKGRPYYEPALLAIEVRGPGRQTMTYLINGYPSMGVSRYPSHRLYYRPEPSELKRGYAVVSDKPGWDTNSGTRGDVITAMRRALVAAYRAVLSGLRCPIPDMQVLDEASDFLLSKRGRYEAMAGVSNDDRLFSLGIGHIAMDFFQHLEAGVEESKPEIPDEATWYLDERGVLHFNEPGVWRRAIQASERGKRMIF